MLQSGLALRVHPLRYADVHFVVIAVILSSSGRFVILRFTISIRRTKIKRFLQPLSLGFEPMFFSDKYLVFGPAIASALTRNNDRQIVEGIELHTDSESGYVSACISKARASNTATDECDIVRIAWKFLGKSRCVGVQLLVVMLVETASTAQYRST